MDELRRNLAGRGREACFQAFALYDLDEDGSAGRPTYEEIATRLGVTTATVTNYLAAARRELRRILLDRLREITGSEEEFRSEARLLLGIDVA